MLNSICSNNTNKLSPQEHFLSLSQLSNSSNNTNKLSPQEPFLRMILRFQCSNNTNKLSPQELDNRVLEDTLCSNNTNKLSPQEHEIRKNKNRKVQIIQINLVLKNCRPYYSIFMLYLQYILSISIIKC